MNVGQLLEQNMTKEAGRFSGMVEALQDAARFAGKGSNWTGHNKRLLGNAKQRYKNIKSFQQYLADAMRGESKGAMSSQQAQTLKRLEEEAAKASNRISDATINYGRTRGLHNTAATTGIVSSGLLADYLGHKYKLGPKMDNLHNSINDVGDNLATMRRNLREPGALQGGSRADGGLGLKDLVEIYRNLPAQ